MVLVLSLGRSAQPYLGETECHSFAEMPWAVSQRVNSFQRSSESPRVAAMSLAEGGVFLPVKAFEKSILAFFLDFKSKFTPGGALYLSRSMKVEKFDLRGLILLLEAWRDSDIVPRETIGGEG